MSTESITSKRCQTEMFLVELTWKEIDIHRILRAISHPDAGGQVLFLGTTRRFTASGSTVPNAGSGTQLDQATYHQSRHFSETAVKQPGLAAEPTVRASLEDATGAFTTDDLTEYLVYEAHETMALKQLNLLARQAVEKWPLKAVAIVHRLGKVFPEESSIAIGVSSPHRSEAFEASRWLIDSIKRDVPIWKQEHFADQSAKWVHPDLHQANRDVERNHV